MRALISLVMAAALLAAPQAANAASLPPVRDECVSPVKALPQVIDNIWRKWGADRSPLGCPTNRELVQRKRELSGGVDGVVEMVTFQFGVVIEAPRLGAGGWIALYQGSAANLTDSMHLAWGGAPGRIPDSAITVGWWSDDLAREPYRRLEGSRFAKSENAWSWINLHNNLRAGRKYSVQLTTPGTCVTAGTPGYCYLAPAIFLHAQQPRECKSVPIGSVGTYWREELKRSTKVWGCPVGVTGIKLPGYPQGASRQHFENGALTYRPDDDGGGAAMVISAHWETRTNAKRPMLMVFYTSTFRRYDVWQLECTRHHGGGPCSQDNDESLSRPTAGVATSVGDVREQAGRPYVSYTFQGQGCVKGGFLAGSRCSGWGPPVTLRWPKPANVAPGG